MAIQASGTKNWVFASFSSGPVEAWKIEQITQGLADQYDIPTSPVFFDLLGGPLWAPPTMMVRFAPHISTEKAHSLLAEVAPGAMPGSPNWNKLSGAFRVQLPWRNGALVFETANQLAAMEEVLWAEPDVFFSGKGAQQPTDDPKSVETWQIWNEGQYLCEPAIDIGARGAWEYTMGDPSIITMVFESGVQLDHPDLQANVADGKDFTGNNSGGYPTNPCENHGTPVAGLIVMEANNDLIGAGVAPNTRIASARTFEGKQNPCTGGWTTQMSWTVDALIWAEQIGVRVTNNSNSYGFKSDSVKAEYKRTRDEAGMVHFASAGNDYDVGLTYPASLKTINAIGAIYTAGQRAAFSNRSNNLAFVAPGADTFTTDRTGTAGINSYGDATYFSGTSAASPCAAGVAALLLSYDPSMDTDRVEALLIASAQDLGVKGKDQEYGHGLIDARRAFEIYPSVEIQAQAIGGDRQDFDNRTTSRHGDVSGDGRFIAFESQNAYLVPNDSNGVADVFLRDMQSGIVERVSIRSSGGQANGRSFDPSVSDDGRFIAFSSDATNLVAGDTNEMRDIFVHDRFLDTTVRVSLGTTGAECNGPCSNPDISGDGTQVVFHAFSDNMVPGLSWAGRIYVHELAVGVTSLASIDSSANPFTGNLGPGISDDGTMVMFYSFNAIDPLDTNGTCDIYVHNQVTGVTSWVSKDSSDGPPNGWSGFAEISGDGNFIVFLSWASDLVAGDTNGQMDVFLRDLALGTNERISVTTGGVEGDFNSGRVAISHDGQYVLFQTLATNLVPGDTNLAFDILIKDRVTGSLSRISLDSMGGQIPSSSSQPVINDDGSHIAFTCAANNIVPGDVDDHHDVFLITPGGLVLASD